MLNYFFYEYYGIRVEPHTCHLCWESRNKRNIGKNKFLLKPSGISHTKKAYSTGSRKIYTLIDLTHFPATNAKIIYWYWSWNCDCADNEQTLSLNTRPRTSPRIWDLFFWKSNFVLQRKFQCLKLTSIASYVCVSGSLSPRHGSSSGCG